MRNIQNKLSVSPKLLVIRNSLVIGGAELYYLKLADAFKKNNLNYKIVLITNNVQLVQKTFSYNNLEAQVVNVFNEEIGTKRGLLRLGLKLPVYLWSYLRIIYSFKRKQGVDLVLFSGTTEKIVLTPILKLFGFPVIWLEHGQVFTPTKAKEVLIIYKLISRFASIILAEAHDTEDNLLRNGVEKSKIQYLGSGIDTEYFSPSNFDDKKEFIVGYMASITWEKGIKVFLDVAETICKKHLTIKFLVIGDGPQLTWAKKFVRQNKLIKSIKFVGYQTDPRKYLRKMSIFLSSISHPGGLSLSVETAMATEIVPIVTDVGGNRELVINEITGFILSNHYIRNASKLIFQLMNDKKQLMKISFAARKHIVNNYNSKLLSRRWNLIVNGYIRK